MSRWLGHNRNDSGKKGADDSLLTRIKFIGRGFVSPRVSSREHFTRRGGNVKEPGEA